MRSAVPSLDVALVTCRQLPEPDPDAALLLDALTQAGLRAAWLAWDDPDVDWARARLSLLRTTWNYAQHHEAFAEWLSRVAAVSTLLNPLPVVRWNLHKRYLLELEAAGVPVAPTALCPRGTHLDLKALLAARGWHRVVIKPAVSAGSYRTRRFDPARLPAAQEFLDALVAERDALVQAYLPAVEDHGERCLVWIDGALTHAVRKSPRFTGDDERVTGPLPIGETERALALQAIGQVPGPLVYARADMAPGLDGRPVIMELEMIEPSLFFAHGPQALARLTAALHRRMAA